MERKVLSTAALVSMLLLVGVQLVKLGQANPYIRRWEKAGEIPPPEGTLPPLISIISPQNNTAYASNNVSLTLNVSIPESNSVSLRISELYYVPSWIHGANNELVKINVPHGSIGLTEVPEGPRWLEVYAVASATAYETGHKIEGIQYTTYYVIYKITSSSIVKFTVDNTAPKILSVSVENRTYAIPNVPLNVIVNEPVSQVVYSLDGQNNRTVAGNTTLNIGSKGEHTLTVRVLDSAENAGSFKTFCFSVDMLEPLPVSVATVSIIAAVVSVSLLVYIKKRKK